MKIQNNNDNTLNIFSSADKAIQEPSKPVSSYVYQAEINITDGNLKFSFDRKNWCDAKRLYFVNKDGSGRKVSSWSTSDYPKGTFSKLYENVRKTCNEKQTTALSDDDISAFITEFETLIDE